MHVDLTGRVVLITGASSGIGQALARSAAAGGAKVVLAARRTDNLAALAKEISPTGAAALAVSMDVTDEASVVAAYDAAENKFGPIDTVIANAGVGSRGRATELPVEEFDALMAVNLRGVFLTAREGAKRMIAAGAESHQRGRIVIISSATAITTTQSLSAYSASKAAVLHLGRSFAREWIRLGINVNVVLPGYILTELNDALFESAAGETLMASFPRRRLVAMEDVLAPVLFLASDAARAVTGAAIVVDDGQLL